MPLRRTLELSPDQRAERLAPRDYDACPFVRERGAALLKIADGMSPHAVARHGLLKARAPDTRYEGLTWYERLVGFFSVEHFQAGGAHRRSL